MPFFPQFSNLFVAPYTPTAQLNPADIGGLAVWLKADTGVTESGGVVTIWEDQSGNGNDASNGTSPVLIASAINGMPAIEFSNGAWLQIPENNIGDSGNLSVFIAINYTSGGVLLNKGDAATFENTAWEMTPQNGFGFVKNDGGNYSWNVVNFTPSGLSLITMITTSGVTELFNNNTSEGTSSDATPVNQVYQYIGIGGGGTDGNTTEGLEAEIAEIIIYDSALSTQDKDGVQAYLNDKYAIY